MSRNECAAEMITIRFAGWISGRIMSLQPDTDPDIRNAFFDISRIQIFGKSCILHNRSFIIINQKHLFRLLCHDSKSACGVITVP